MGKKKDFTFGESMSIVPIKLSSRDREAVALVAIKAAARNCLDIFSKSSVYVLFSKIEIKLLNKKNQSIKYIQFLL